MLYERHYYIRLPQDQKIPHRVNLLQINEVFPLLHKVQVGVRFSVDHLKQKQKTDGNKTSLKRRSVDRICPKIFLNPATRYRSSLLCHAKAANPLPHKVRCKFKSVMQKWAENAICNIQFMSIRHSVW